MHGCSLSLTGFANSKNASNRWSGSDLYHTQHTIYSCTLTQSNTALVLWVTQEATDARNIPNMVLSIYTNVFYLPSQLFMQNIISIYTTM